MIRAAVAAVASRRRDGDGAGSRTDHGAQNDDRSRADRSDDGVAGARSRDDVGACRAIAAGCNFCV